MKTKAQTNAFSNNQFTKIKSLEGLKVKCILRDSYGFMWFGTETGLYRYDGENTEVLNTASPNLHLSSDVVLALFEDKEKNLWIGTGNGLQELTSNRKNIKTFLSTGKEEEQKTIYAITEMSDGSLWCSSDDGYVYRAADKKNFSRIQTTFITVNKIHRIVLKIAEDSNNNVWLADNEFGFQELDLNGKELHRFFYKRNVTRAVCYAEKSSCLYTVQQKVYEYSSKQNAFIPLISNELSKLIKKQVQYIYRDKKGYQWLVTQNKLIRFNPTSKQADNFTPQFMSSGASFFQISCMYEDVNDQLWFGSYFGVYKLNNRKSLFKTITLPNGINSNTFFSTRGIAELDSNLFIGSYSGFFEYNKVTNRFTEYKIKEDNIQINPLARAIVKDKNNNLWIATEAYGLLYFNTKTHAFTSYFNRGDSLNETNIPPAVSTHNYSLLLDNNGKLWLGGYYHLYTFNIYKRTGQIFTLGQKNKIAAPLKILAICKSDDQSIWLGTDQGLFCLKKSIGKIIHYTFSNQNFINCIYEDDNGLIWLGTLGGGINVLNPKNGKVQKTFTEKDGLPDNRVCAILRGNVNDIWISTYNGLSVLNLKDKSFRNFYTGDGLSGNEFNQGSALAGDDGNLYFGSVNGIDFFNPKQFILTPKVSQVMLTKLVQHNGEKNKIQETAIGITALKNIRLNYKDQFFTVYFVLKDYFESVNTHWQFAYKLDGLSDEWQNIGSVNYIQFAGLPAGNYTLRIKGMGSNGSWGKELSIPVKVGKAFYATTGAYIFYFVILFSIIGIIYWFQLSKIRLRNQLQIEHLQQEKLQELDEMKSRFFTNITHEFRTPLTLIQGPAEKILSEVDDVHVKRWASVIRKNSRQMLHLINQLLDLSRIEAGQEKLQLTYTDLIPFIKDIAITLNSLAEQKKIELLFETSVPSLNMLFDTDKLRKALHNLLANAIKFTPANGKINVVVTKSINTNSKTSEAFAVIKVHDTGIGIAPEHINSIFNRFYRIANAQNHPTQGTGIGLALVKEFTELHDGKVAVSSVPGEGSVFTISLPVRTKLSEDKAEEIPLPLVTPNAETDLFLETSSENIVQSIPEKNSTKPIILITEDHKEIRDYIRDILLPDYQVLETANGVDGVQLARKTIPDLIISDIRMPEMDGNMLCLLLKQDERTSHIPIILLTAKAGQEHRIQGLQVGADAYINKPFDERELLLQIKNFLNLRKQIAERVMHNAHAPVTESVSVSEKSFLERFTAITDAHIDDENFGVEKMLKQIGMSRSQLHRKLKAVTGLSAGNLIRVIRLQRGMELLQQNKFTISEVAYKVGFSSPSYFGECFHKHFGYPPSEVRKKTL